ncbi:hypothetical protein D3C84_698790 [compost metagenome]
MVGRVLAGGDDGGLGDPQDPVDQFRRRVRRGEHQEQVLTGRRIGQAELQVLARADEDFVQQVDGIVGVGIEGLLERFVEHGPDLAPGGGFFYVRCEDDCTGRPAGPTEDDIVVGVGVQQDAGAVERIQPAVHTVERRTGAADEADIGNGCARRGVDRERIAAGVAHGAGIAAQGCSRRGPCTKCGQATGEGRGEGRDQNVVVIRVCPRARRGGAVLQIGGFIQRYVDAGCHDPQAGAGGCSE